jgi:CPA2 family monovalent cation:H+ antiporter-2
MLRERYWALGRSVTELELDALGATLVNLRRYGDPALSVNGETPVRAGDVLVLRGEPEALAAAEIRLSEG